MTAPDLDLLEFDHRARARGLPAPLAAAVARLTIRGATDSARRAALFDELVAHFEDGLAANESVADLLADFGDPDATAALVAVAAAPGPNATPRPRSAMPTLDLVWREVRLAARRLALNPAFAATAAVVLAFGIGTITTVFSAINAVVLRPWAIANIDEVYDLYEATDNGLQPLTNPDLRDLERATTDVLAAAAGTRFTQVQVGVAGSPAAARASVEIVTARYFDLVGVPPALGRLIGPADDLAPGGHPVVVLSHRYWRRHHGGDSAVIGRSLRLNGREYTVVGVASERYQGNIRALAPDLAAPMAMVNSLLPSEADFLESRELHGMLGKVRLAPGVTRAAAQASLDRVAASLREQNTGIWSAPSAHFRIVPTKDAILFPDADPKLRRLSGALLVVVGLLLLVICANLAGFLLARGIDRRRDVAVQLAVGATRGRVMMPLVLESLLLSFAGGLGGVALTYAAARLLASVELPLPVPVALEIAPDPAVLVFAAVATVLTGLAFGVAPALKATRPDLIRVLRDESGGSSRDRGRFRGALVVVQVAVAVVLVVTTAALLGAARQLATIDPGFGREPTAVLRLALPPDRYPAARRLAGWRELATALARLPGVGRVGVVDNIHLNLMNTQTDGVRNPADNAAADRAWLEADRVVVDTGFFAAAGIALLRGRDFAVTDDAGPPVAIINQALAERLWPGQDPIGRRFEGGGGLVEVVALASNVKVRTLTEPPRPLVYYPLAAQRPAGAWLLLRTATDADQLASLAAREVGRIDPDVITTTVTTVERHVGIALLPFRIGAWLLSVLALVAMGLSVVGLAGVVRYAVARRRREVGIRLALGADAGAVVRLLAMDGWRLAVTGIAVGSALAAVIAMVLVRTFGQRVDLPLLVAAPLALAAAVGVAAWLPARRAARIDPANALRQAD